MSKKGHDQKAMAGEHHGPESTHRGAQQLGGDGDHVAAMQHANAEHGHAGGAGAENADEVTKHREAHFGMSPTPKASKKPTVPVKPTKTGKHARQ